MALAEPDLAGIHFTGSTATFQSLWQTVGANIARYRTYPRIVGETGGKDFVVAHPLGRPRRAADRADPRRLRVPGAEVLGGLPRLPPAQSCGQRIKDDLVAEVDGLTMGDVTDLSNFMGARDRRPGLRQEQGGDRPRARQDADGRARSPAGQYDDAIGYFVRPTVLLGTDPRDEIFSTEYFGPILAVHVYDDSRYDAMPARRWTAPRRTR